jgi:uncharacterized membrane protein HdeD (DUF308 family)
MDWILAVIGGVILVIFGLISIFSSPFVGIFTVSLISGLDALLSGIILLIAGVIAIAGAKWTSHILWGIILLIVGFIAGGVGGTMIFIGALLGVLSRLMKSK